MSAELGPLDGPVLVFGGPYGNLEATRALIEAAGRLGIPGSRAICTGDVVAYCADPQATVDAVREWGARVLMGNCEESLAAAAEDCGCGFAEASECAALSAAWFSATRRDLDAETKTWMGRLPRRMSFTLAGRRLGVVHGGATRINRFLFASSPDAHKEEEIAAAGRLGAPVDGVIAGHCGMPFAEVIGGRLWLNAGAIGMPANDGTPRTWFATLMPRKDAIAVDFHALDYDHGKAAAKMRACSHPLAYPLAYADALATGLWPSQDVLPPAERAERGRPLAPAALLWSTCLTAAPDRAYHQNRGDLSRPACGPRKRIR